MRYVSLSLSALLDSPCYSTELQPCQHVLVHWSGNSPQRSRWCQVCPPGEETIQYQGLYQLGALRGQACCCPEANSCLCSIRRVVVWQTTYNIQRNNSVFKKGLNNHRKVLSAIVAASIDQFLSFNLENIPNAYVIAATVMSTFKSRCLSANLYFPIYPFYFSKLWGILSGKQEAWTDIPEDQGWE